MILEIDSGNNYLKWRVCDEGSVIKRGRISTKQTTYLATLNIQHLPIQRVRIVNVAGSKITRELTTWCGDNFQLTAEFAQSESQCGGIVNAYPEASQLGVDRWLALLAAYNDKHTACCVVDCGTAITVDVVNDKGQHLGGYIGPGLQLMKNTLTQNTDQINVDFSNLSMTPTLGVDTQQAVSFGVLQMALGLIHQTIRLCREIVGEHIQLYVTGGDASILIPHLCNSVIHKPELVLDGLAIVLP